MTPYKLQKRVGGQANKSDRIFLKDKRFGPKVKPSCLVSGLFITTLFVICVRVFGHNTRTPDDSCDTNFSRPVDYIVEPEEVRNFTQFSLDYVITEDSNIFYEPRFAGHQTLEERELSFLARDQKIHCGFVKPLSTDLDSNSKLFDVSEKDMEFMSTCKIAVSSAIFGSCDLLRRLLSKNITDFSKENICFVIFIDEQTLYTLSLDGHKPDENGYIGLWKVVVVNNLPYDHTRRGSGRVPKFLSHRLFLSARYSIWVDSKVRLNADPMEMIERYLWRTKSEYAISTHYNRQCVFEEFQQNKRLHKFNLTAMDNQLRFYINDGLTIFDPSDSNNLLPSYVPESSIIIRAHTPMSNLFSCLWFNEVDRFTPWDQLSFAYTYLKLRRSNPTKPFYVYMFKDCERRAMADQFGHRRPPPPIV